MLKKFLKISLIASLPVFMASCGNEETGSTEETEMNDELSTEEADPTEEEPVNESSTEDAPEADTNSEDETSSTTSYPEGSWAYTVQSFINGSGAGEQTFALDQIVLSDDSEGEESVTVAAEKQMDELASLLKSNPAIQAEVQGHSKKADNAIGKTAKKAWSKTKALFFRKKLENRGVNTEQLRHEGFGEQFLLEGVDGKDAKQNRIMVKLSRS